MGYRKMRIGHIIAVNPLEREARPRSNRWAVFDKCARCAKTIIYPKRGRFFCSYSCGVIYRRSAAVMAEYKAWLKANPCPADSAERKKWFKTPPKKYRGESSLTACLLPQSGANHDFERPPA